MMEDRLGNYQLLSLIGHGSMSDVHMARHKRLGRNVAIKIVHPHLLDRPGAMKRFEREAAALAAMRHPNIVRVYEYLLEEEQAYIVMEYLGGGTLSERLQDLRKKGKNAELDQVQEWMDSICNAVDFAHNRGLIHRDLKPVNILFRENGEIVLTDFGLAFLMDHPRLSPSNAITGTPAYLSPEQAQGHSGDERSDVYSLGIILYEILTGEPPFRGNAVSVILQHVTEEPLSPRSLNRSIPREVEAVLMRALAKNPVERYQSAMALSRALKQAIARASEPARTEAKPTLELGEPEDSQRTRPLPLAVSIPSDFRRTRRAAQMPKAGTQTRKKKARPALNSGQFLGVGAVLLVLAGMVFWAIRGSSHAPDGAAELPQLAAGDAVSIEVSGGGSTSVYRACPGTLVSGFLGVVSDGLTGSVTNRRWCGDGWWYEVEVAEKDLLDWQGVGYIDGAHLERR